MSRRGAGQGRGVTYVEGRHTLPLPAVWGTLHPLGKGRHVVTCGRCKTGAEGFTVSALPGKYAKDRGWRIWRRWGWVCPACEAAWHGVAEAPSPQQGAVVWLTWQPADSSPAPAAVRLIFAPRQGFGAVQVGTWDPGLRLWSTASHTWRPENVTHWAELPRPPAHKR